MKNLIYGVKHILIPISYIYAEYDNETTTLDKIKGTLNMGYIGMEEMAGSLMDINYSYTRGQPQVLPPGRISTH